MSIPDDDSTPTAVERVPLLATSIVRDGLEPALEGDSAASEREGGGDGHRSVSNATGGAEGADVRFRGEIERVPLPREPSASRTRTFVEPPLLSREALPDGAGAEDSAFSETQPVIALAIIGENDLTEVPDTTSYPWRWICSLRIHGFGKPRAGTGFLVGPRTVLTAGHCVFDTDDRGERRWAAEIEVIPGRNASTAPAPFGSARSHRFHTVEGWMRATKEPNPDFDYGAIILPEDAPFGARLGYFGLAALRDDTLRKTVLNLAGYLAIGPATEGRQFFHSRKPKDVSPGRITYDIDTEEGMSGSPVFRLLDRERHVVGIHTLGKSTGNSATRLSAHVLKNIMGWI